MRFKDKPPELRERTQLFADVVAVIWQHHKKQIASGTRYFAPVPHYRTDGDDFDLIWAFEHDNLSDIPGLFSKGASATFDASLEEFVQDPPDAPFLEQPINLLTRSKRALHNVSRNYRFAAQRIATLLLVAYNSDIPINYKTAVRLSLCGDGSQLHLLRNLSRETNYRLLDSDTPNGLSAEELRKMGHGHCPAALAPSPEGRTYLRENGEWSYSNMLHDFYETTRVLFNIRLEELVQAKGLAAVVAKMNQDTASRLLLTSLTERKMLDYPVRTPQLL